MNKPEVRINLNIDFEKMHNDTKDGAVAAIESVVAHALLVQEEIAVRLFVKEPDKPFNPNAFVPPERPNSRHYQAVAANQRISDAVEYINKEIRLQTGAAENGCRKILDEIKRILLAL